MSTEPFEQTAVDVANAVKVKLGDRPATPENLKAAVQEVWADVLRQDEAIRQRLSQPVNVQIDPNDPTRILVDFPIMKAGGKRDC